MRRLRFLLGMVLCSGFLAGIGFISCGDDEQTEDGQWRRVENKYVFITNQEYNGALKTLAGADELCQGQANAAGLSGTFMAWLSDDTGSPHTRFRRRPNFRYIRVDGALVARDWADLTDGELVNPIDITADGIQLTFRDNPYVWSNTKINGRVFNGTGPDASRHCQGWLSAAFSDLGNTGWAIDVDPWTEYHSPLECSGTLRLYCFQQ